MRRRFTGQPFPAGSNNLDFPRKERSGFRQRAPASLTPAKRLNWCTGKDSNLRTSLGGTDLQSVGFNHSPTCANFPGRCGRRAPSNRKPCRVTGSHSRKPADQVQPNFRNPGKPRIRANLPRRSLVDHCTPEKIRMECWKNLLRPLPTRRLAAETHRFASLSGAGEGI